jgi:hypothetical protein
MLPHVNDFAAIIIEQELEFYQRYGPANIVQAYKSLKESLNVVKQTSHSCLVQIAWGTGWRSKTVGLGFNAGKLDEVSQQFTLGMVTHNVCHKRVVPAQRGQGWYCKTCRQAGLGLGDVTFHKVFPKTRRLVEFDQEPIVPLGWLLLTFEPAGEDIIPPVVRAIVQTPSRQATVPAAKRQFADLRVGEVVEGRVANTTDFGAFVDIGAEKDGLIHTSQLGASQANRTEDVVRRGDMVTVEIIRVDTERHRIGLRLIGKK